MRACAVFHRRRRHWPPVRAGRCRGPNRPSEPSDEANARRLPRTDGSRPPCALRLHRLCRSCGPGPACASILSLPRKASSGLRPGKAAACWDRGAGRSRTAPLPASISRSVRRISRLPWNFTVSLCALSLVPRWELSRQGGAAKKKGPAQADPKGTLDLYRVLRRIRPPVRGAGGLIKPRPAIGSLATGRLSPATGAGDCCRKGQIMAAHHGGVRFPAGPARAGLVEPCRPWRVGRERGFARQRTVRDWLETFG